MKAGWHIAVGVVFAATFAPSAARAWEAVTWPGTTCENIDHDPRLRLVYSEFGSLTNTTNVMSRIQCPVRTPSGLGPQDLVTWTGAFLTPEYLDFVYTPPLCLLRIASVQGELLETRLTDLPGPQNEQGTVTFDWQPADVERYGVAQTTAIVRCELPPAAPLFSLPGRGISSVTGPGDGDTGPHRWPGTMCRPRAPFNHHAAETTGLGDFLYNSAGTIANVDTLDATYVEDHWVVCPIPIPHERGEQISLHVQVEFLSEAPRFCRLRIVSTAGAFEQEALSDTLVQQNSGKTLAIDTQFPAALYPPDISASVTCSLGHLGAPGPAGITSYSTEVH